MKTVELSKALELLIQLLVQCKVTLHFNGRILHIRKEALGFARKFSAQGWLLGKDWHELQLIMNHQCQTKMKYTGSFCSHSGHKVIDD